MSMKKCLAMLLCCAMMLGLCACGGDVSDVEILDCPSEFYTDREIREAINTVKRYFKKEFDDCTLTQIAYLGDEGNKVYADDAARYDADEVIVLVSSFDVGPSGGDGSLEPNGTYTKWKWILVRDRGGSWRHVDHGY